MKLILPVNTIKASSEYKIDSDLKLSDEDFISTNIVFYNIDALEPVKGNKTCFVYSSGREFQILLPFEVVEDMIDVAKNTIIIGAN